MKSYEGVFFLSETIEDEAAAKVWAGVKAEIEKLGGSVKSEKFDGRRSFARPLAKKRGGHYGELLFELGPDQVNALTHSCKMNDDISRAMIVHEFIRTEVPEEPESDSDAEEVAAEAAAK